MTLRRFMSIMHYGGARPESVSDVRWTAMLNWYDLNGHNYGPDGKIDQEADRHPSKPVETTTMQGVAA
jgi:hypothetical protein